MLPLPAPLVSLLLVLGPAADGWLGVYLGTEGNAVVIAEVIPGSPAAKAGLQAGDQLLAVGDQATATTEAFIAAVRAASPGDRIRLKIRRQSRESILVVKLGERPDPAAVAPAAPVAPSKGQPPQPQGESAAPSPVAVRAGKPYLGLSVQQTITGVVVERVVPDSPAAAAGVQAGEVVTRAGEQPIRSLADLDRVLDPLAAGGKLALELRSLAGVRSVLVELGTRDERPDASGMPAVKFIGATPTKYCPAASGTPAPAPAALVACVNR